MPASIEASATVEMKKIERIHAARLAIAETEFGAARNWHLPFAWLLGVALAAIAYFSQFASNGVAILIGIATVTATLAQAAFQQSVRLNKRLDAVIALVQHEA